MSWLVPTSADEARLAEEQRPELKQLAQALALAPHVEPNLMRKARMQFLPGSRAELEAELWFSPLMARRSALRVVMHGGVARRLTEQLKRAEPITDAEFTLDWAAVQRFWADTAEQLEPLDKAAIQLRLAAFDAGPEAVKVALEPIVQILSTADNQQRQRVARWARDTLPETVRDDAGSGAEAVAWLAGLGAAFGDLRGHLSARTGQQPLPHWLRQHIEIAARQMPPMPLGVRLRPGVLECAEADDDAAETIELRTSPPAPVLITPLPGGPEGPQSAPSPEGLWAPRYHQLFPGQRVRLPENCTSVELETLHGARWLLGAKPGQVAATAGMQSRPIALVHAPDDARAATELAAQLRERGLHVEPVADSGEAQTGGDENVFAIRLWTEAAMESAPDASGGTSSGALICLGGVEPPDASGDGQTFHFKDFDELLSDGALSELSAHVQAEVARPAATPPAQVLVIDTPSHDHDDHVNRQVVERHVQALGYTTRSLSSLLDELDAEDQFDARAGISRSALSATRAAFVLQPAHDRAAWGAQRGLALRLLEADVRVAHLARNPSALVRRKGTGPRFRPPPTRVYLSYDGTATTIVETVLDALAAPRNRGAIDVWHYRMEDAEDDSAWSAEEQLLRSDVFVLLVTPAYFDSSFIRSRELPRILERAREFNDTVIPVYVEALPDASLIPTAIDQGTLAKAALGGIANPLHPLAELSPERQRRELRKLCRRLETLARKEPPDRRRAEQLLKMPRDSSVPAGESGKTRSKPPWKRSNNISDTNALDEFLAGTSLERDPLVMVNVLNDPELTPPLRLAIGDRLAELGDPRPGVGLRPDGLPDIDWIEVPGGEFIWQDGEVRELPSFYLARYPITNAQFDAFIRDGGYENEEWWAGLERMEPAASRWTQPNRPRTDVSWFEAVAFCRWLSARLEREIRLPIEMEWEKAARNADSRVYPWGDTFGVGMANVDEQEQKDGPWYLQETTAVGVYPHGNSPPGHADVAGNVWEWCLNGYEQPDIGAERAANLESSTRVLRGGSWVHAPEDARADDRLSNDPVGRGDLVGFRVLSSSPILNA
ncbi:MAG: SUMF1/EgtB/PvdO family nonheme iron enzyme [Pseudomonadota bacterium]